MDNIRKDGYVTLLSGCSGVGVKIVYREIGTNFIYDSFIVVLFNRKEHNIMTGCLLSERYELFKKLRDNIATMRAKKWYRNVKQIAIISTEIIY